jgi:hypothetical protein
MTRPNPTRQQRQDKPNQQKERQEQKQKQSSRRKATRSDWQITSKNDVIFGLK